MSGLFQFLRSRVGRPGRDKALERLFRELGGRLYQYALTITRRPVDAEEVLQDVFMQLVAQPAQLDRVEDARAYLYRATRNQALNRVHRRDREVPSLSSVFEREADTEDSRLGFEQALSDLPDEQREVVILKVWQDLTFREIAALLDISPNTAASRYRYALERLKQSMAGEVYVR